MSADSYNHSNFAFIHDKIDSIQAEFNSFVKKHNEYENSIFYEQVKTNLKIDLNQYYLSLEKDFSNRASKLDIIKEEINNWTKN